MLYFKGIIFDKDGVICSTDRFHYLAWKQVIEPLSGVPFDDEVYDRLRGTGREKSMEIIAEAYGMRLSQREKKALCDAKNNIYQNCLASLSTEDAGKGVYYTLQELRRRGVKVAIGSSSKNTRAVLERLCLLDQFDAIADGNCISKSKPDPEVFLKAAAMLQLTPQDCLVEEDARAGIDAAKAGGFVTAGLCSAAHYVKTDYKIEQVSDILSLLAN